MAWLTLFFLNLVLTRRRWPALLLNTGMLFRHCGRHAIGLNTCL